VIEQERIKSLNSKRTSSGDYVLYWMQASQRAECNHALEQAILSANELKKPLVVYFGLTDRFPEANLRHYWFMLEGIREVQRSLKDRGIKTVIRRESPERGIVALSRRACLVVVDRGYLKVQRQWRAYASEHVHCPLIQVETDVVVPVEAASPKEEYSAATFRPKIMRRLSQFLAPLEERQARVDSTSLELPSLDLEDVRIAVAGMGLDRSVGVLKDLQGGTREAKSRLAHFVSGNLDRYEESKNDPTVDGLSHMSPYLHFGQISPIFIGLKVRETVARGADAYLEELIVRRELSINSVHYNRNYDSFDGLPGWAQKTLVGHEEDPREYSYSLEELENASTHDPYWNAAQQEMRISGKMHGYMRMYWGKKIIEWTRSPRDGFRIALHLNNKYELDGRDPNGFTGVAWCFGRHDRPWQGRPVLGNVRYMNDRGLRRKFDADEYARRWAPGDQVSNAAI